MDDQQFKKLFGLTEQDKQDMIRRISEDISWTQEDLINGELDIDNIEELGESQDETF